jgi:hypothetical protein
VLTSGWQSSSRRRINVCEDAVNELELHAYGKIAQTLAERAFNLADSEPKWSVTAFPDVGGPIYRHYGNSTFEDLASVLWRLGILRSLEPELKLARYFAIDCELKEAEIVAQRNWQNGPSLPELLEVFIDLFDEYGKEYHDFSSSIYVPFGRNGRLTAVLDALASIGYIEKTSEGYVWTDAEPVMRILYGFDSLSDPAAFKPTF